MKEEGDKLWTYRTAEIKDMPWEQTKDLKTPLFKLADEYMVDYYWELDTKMRDVFLKLSTEYTDLMMTNHINTIERTTLDSYKEQAELRQYSQSKKFFKEMHERYISEYKKEAIIMLEDEISNPEKYGFPTQTLSNLTI